MFAEDLAPFFDTVTGFAQACTFSNGVAADCIFDNGYAEALQGAGTTPTLTAATTAVATVVRGHTVTVNAVGYTVANVEADGTGVTTLVLERT
jgi:hypothetical protein